MCAVSTSCGRYDILIPDHLDTHIIFADCYSHADWNQGISPFLSVRDGISILKILACLLLVA